MFRIRAWMCARLLPGVRWWRSRMRDRPLQSLISMPLRSRVAWMEDAICVYPADRSTTRRGAAAPPGPPRTPPSAPRMASVVRARMRDVAFTRWDPLRDLLTLHEQIGQLVGTDAPGWTPPVDLYETPTEFILT